MGVMMVNESVKDKSLLLSPGLRYKPTQHRKSVFKVTEISEGFVVVVVCLL